MFSGRFVKADEALAIGLVDAVVPAADVYATARSMMARYVGGPAYALRAAKEAIDRGLELDLESGLEIERTLFAGTVRHQGPGHRHEALRREGQGPGAVRGRLTQRWRKPAAAAEPRHGSAAAARGSRRRGRAHRTAGRSSATIVPTW